MKEKPEQRVKIKKAKSPRRLVRVKRVNTEVRTEDQTRGRKEEGAQEEEDHTGKWARGVPRELSQNDR